MKQLGKNILRYVFGVLAFIFIFCAQNINVEAAESISERTTTTGSATYDPNNGSDTQDYYDFTYTIGDTSKTAANDSNIATITNYNICNNSGNCTIPSTVKVKYKSSSDTAYKTYTLKVTAVGNGSSKICSPYGKITVGNNVTTINNNAFSGASSATSITIGNKVTKIGNNAFYGCSSAKTLIFTATSTCTSIGTSAFQNCSTLSTVAIPNSVTTIGSSAFYGCTSLNTLTIGTGVTSIGSNAFYNAPLATRLTYNATSDSVALNDVFVNKQIASVAIGSGVTKIPNNFIKGNTAITSITIPAKCTSIGNNAFDGCTSLKTITFASGSKCITIGNNAFYGCTALTAITVPNSVITIEDYAFYNCSSLATVTLGTGVTTLGYNTFRGTTPLTTLTINSNISGHNYAFKGHTGLTTLKIGSSLTNIYANMFQGCPNISKVDISGSNVTSIGAYAFEGCKKLNTKNAFAYAAFDASLSGTVGEYAFRFGGFTSGASAGLPSVSVSQSVVEDNNYFPTSGGIGKVTMNISASPATANEGKDYIVILDTTGSMDSKVNGVSKMTTAKNALQKFADTIMEVNAENRIAIVHFRGNIDTNSDGTDDSSGGYCYLDFTKDKSTISTKIADLKANAGGARIATASGSNTNYRLGIIAALNVMQMRGAESSVTAGGVTYGASGGADRNTYVVFISDGAANAQTSYITPLSKILKAAADEIWSIGICVEDSGETTEYLKMINTTMYGQDLFIDFPSADLEAAMTDFLKQVVSMSTSSIYNTVLTSVIQSNWVPYKDSSHVWSSGVTNSGQNVSVNIGTMGKESKSYTFYVKLTDAYKIGTMTSKGTYNPIVTNNVHADYKVSGGIYEGQSKTASNIQQYTLPWYAYDVIYNGNGNTGGSTSNQVKIGGINLSLRSNDFTKTAYRFKEWNTKADGTGTKYAAGASYSTNADLTLYAIWEPDTTYYTVKHWKQNIGGNAATHDAYNYTEATADRQTIENVTIGSNQSPAVKTYIGFTSPAVQTVMIAANGTTVVNYYYTRNNYTVTYIDVVGSINGKELGRSTASKPYGSSVKGIDIGASTTDNAYYKNYALIAGIDGYTTATVDTNGATVYRCFRWLSKDISGTVNWTDAHNAYGTRPDEVKIVIFQNGIPVASVVTASGTKDIEPIILSTSGDINHFEFLDMPAYDSAGNPYTYDVRMYDLDATVDIKNPSSVMSLEYPESKYVTTQNGYDIYNVLDNTTEPDGPPEGFTVGGAIHWVDSGNKLGLRPSTVTIELYQDGKPFMVNGEHYTITVDAMNDNTYKFIKLPKYKYVDGEPVPYEYTAVEKIVSNYVKDGVIYPLYDIHTDENMGEYEKLHFTNYIEIDGSIIPIVPGDERDNTITVVTNTEDKVEVVLKMLDFYITESPEDVNVQYGPGYNGDEYNLCVSELGEIIKHIPSGKYEIDVNESKYELTDIHISDNTDNVYITYEDGKYYLVIDHVPEDSWGIVNIELEKKTEYYQSRKSINNYFKAPLAKRIVGGYIELPEDRDVSVVEKLVMRNYFNKAVSDPVSAELPEEEETTEIDTSVIESTEDAMDAEEEQDTEESTSIIEDESEETNSVIEDSKNDSFLETPDIIVGSGN